MRRVKGCLNKKCVCYKKKYYKASDEYCVKCGMKLNYVCKHHKCFKQIPDDVEKKYCPIHEAEKKDNSDKNNDTLKKVGIGGLAVLGAVATIGKTAIDIARKK